MARPATIYLDHHATTPCDPRVVDAMVPAFTETFANAASREHAPGRHAAELVERARAQVATLLECDPREIVFTSGATESDNLALRGHVDHFERGDSKRRTHVVTTAIEHKAVLDTCDRLERAGTRVTYLVPPESGRLDPAQIDAALTPETSLVSVMYANNEIGTIQPIGEIGALCRARGIVFHTDAVQAAGYLPCAVDALNVDLLSLSAHKIYGPKGIGALYVRRRAPRIRLSPLIDGGAHERGLRSGTLNVPGIIGFGRAAEIAVAERARDTTHTRALRDRLLAKLSDAVPELRVNGAGLRVNAAGLRVNGTMEHRLPNNLSVSFAGLDGDRLIGELDGLAVSSGAACTSASRDSSYVLKSLYPGDPAPSASLRFGLGRSTTEEEIDRAVELVAQAVVRLRAAPSDAPSPSGCRPPG